MRRILMILIVLAFWAPGGWVGAEQGASSAAQAQEEDFEAKYNELKARYDRLLKQSAMLRKDLEQAQRENRLLKRQLGQLQGETPRTPGREEPAEPIERRIVIKGTDRFVQRVEEALDLLEARAPDAYRLINTYTDKIEQENRSVARAYKASPQLDLSEKVAFASLTWCASTIANGAYHCKVYQDYKEEYGRDMPDEVEEIKGYELECIRYQMEVARKIGAPRRELAYLNSLDGTEADINKDGKIDEDDYEERER